MTATSRASPTHAGPNGVVPRRHRAGSDSGMVTVEAAIALCAFVTVLGLVLAGMSTVLDQIRCTDAAREGARLVAMGERAAVTDTVRRIAPGDATVAIATQGDGIVVTVRDPAAGGLLPGVHVSADAYAVLEPDATEDSTATAGSGRNAKGSADAGGADRLSRSAGGDGR
jgi:Flp pilus assembly protein TadG